MAPSKAKTNDSSMKQKSLMSFFGKPAADKSSQKLVPERSEKPPTASNASKSRKPSTPEPKGSDMPAPTSSGEASSRSSGGGCSVKQTPPTSSDPIDVDMLSEEETAKERVQAKSVSTYWYDTYYITKIVRYLQTRVKRKIVIDDSDEEDVSLVKKQSSYTASSPKSSATKSKSFRVYVLCLLIMPGRPGEETTCLCRVTGR
jgi:DNA mismatch repair protein MSH6